VDGDFRLAGLGKFALLEIEQDFLGALANRRGKPGEAAAISTSRRSWPT